MAAVLTATGGVESISWLIKGLQNDFTNDFYLGLGICTGEVKANTTEEPEGILQYVYADTDTKFGNFQPGTCYCESGTYTIYGFTQTTDGKYWNVWPESGEVPLIVTVKSTASAVELWNWSTSNGDATAAQTKCAYDILMGTRPVSDGFSFKVWNDLVDKVAEMREALGYEWDTNGGNYLAKNKCYVSAGDTLSAAIYNGVRFQVGSIQGTGIVDRVVGGKILGYHIVHMVEVLNEIIEGL